jgi:hypothetical protein
MRAGMILKKGSGTVVRSNLRAVSATVPDPILTMPRFLNIGDSFGRVNAMGFDVFAAPDARPDWGGSVQGAGGRPPVAGQSEG